MPVCMALFNVCRNRNTDRIFVTFPTQFVMLQKLAELSLSIQSYATLFLGSELLDFV